MPSSPKALKPGDLVVDFLRRNDGEPVAHYALVIGIDHPPNQAHMGCEQRVRVMWSDPLSFQTVCDCEVYPVDGLL